jgi:hypothetical protein
MNSLFEELTQTFPIETVEPYGEVLIIPVKAFREEWRKQLEAEGVQVYSNAYHGQACFFLRKKMQNQTVSEAEKPKPKSVWTKEEEALFLKLYNEGVGFNEICRRLGKTRTQVMGKISSFKKQQKMKHAGNLKPQTLKVESEANADPSFRELLEACLTLYPNHVNICRFLLDKAGEMLKP